MVTGVETAGLVLASIRTIIAVIKAARAGYKTLKAWKNYRTQILELHETVGVFYVIYANNIEQLLDPIVESLSQMHLLLNQPGGPEWKRPELASRLKGTLSTSYESYMSTITSMNETVEKLKSKFGIVDGKVQPVSWHKNKSHILGTMDGPLSRFIQLEVTMETN